MNLIKVTDGLLETENFISASSFPDYFTKKDIIIKNHNNIINTKEQIERNVLYPEFLIEIQKDNWEKIKEGERFLFYVGNNKNIWGIEDNFQEQNKYQKIIYNDKYLQVYVSQDKKNWINLGGLKINLIDKQGFKKISDRSLILKEYKVYRNPYVIIQNFNKGVKVELYDELNNKVKERLFDENLECKIFLDYCMKGYFKFYNINNELIYTSSLFDLKYGDVYCFSDYELEILYKSRVLDDIPTCLDDTEEVISLKNISDNKTYYNLKLFGETKYDDIITLSLDGISYNNYITITQIKPNEVIDIYIKIKKGKTNHNFICRGFELKLEQL